MVGGGVLAGVLSRDAHPAGGTAAVRLALLGGETEHAAARTDAVKGALTRDYKLGTSATAKVSAAAASSTFGQPTIAGIGGWGFEANLRLDPSNADRVYMSAPDSANSDSSFVWRSLDGGKTFKWVPGAAPLGGKVTTCHGGGDTELAVDSKGRLYFNDLTLANFSVARSDDQGRTFTCSNTGVPDAIVDRQWYAVDGDPLNGGSVYLTNDEVFNGNVQCGNTQLNNTLVMYRSPAGGAGATAGLAFGPPNHITAPGTCDEGIMGNNEVSPVATKTGVERRDAADRRQARLRRPRRRQPHEDPHRALLPGRVRCADRERQRPERAQLRRPPRRGPRRSNARTGGNFPSLAIDKAGNLYAVWEQAPYDPVAQHAGDSALMYSYSTDEGNHWSAPVQIPTPGLANNVFAWAAAGDDGRVDIAWYGTPTHVDLVNGGANACPNGGPDSVDGFWSVYFTQTLNGHSSTVTFGTPVVASEHPIRHGSIQTILGNQCGGAPNNQTATNRTLGDFFQLRIGSKGEAQISYADSTSLLNSLLGSHAMYVRQNGGTGVYASLSPKGDAILNSQATDAAKDATYDAAGLTSANMPNLDVARVEGELAERGLVPSGEHAVPARVDEGLEPDDRGARVAGHRQGPRLADAMVGAGGDELHVDRSVVRERRRELHGLRGVVRRRRDPVLRRPELAASVQRRRRPHDRLSRRRRSSRRRARARRCPARTARSRSTSRSRRSASTRASRRSARSSTA